MRKYYSERIEGGENFYTDLAIERRRADIGCDGVDYRVYESNSGSWECIKISSPEGAMSIGRPMGIYDTLNTGRMEMLDDDEIEDAKEDVAKKLCEIFDDMNISPESLLIVGLGNSALTPDSVGPKAAKAVKPTMHIKKFDENMFYALECSEIAVLIPGVSSESGMNSAETIQAVCRHINPSAVIAIDSIASKSQERLGTTVQISNTGIFPGSGIGNLCDGVNEKSLGVPVIAIGVPTVIDSRAFAPENAKGKRHENSNLIVSPKEIDEITDVASSIIGGAINQAFGIYS